MSFDQETKFRGLLTIWVKSASSQDLENIIEFLNLQTDFENVYNQYKKIVLDDFIEIKKELPFVSDDLLVEVFQKDYAFNPLSFFIKTYPYIGQEKQPKTFFEDLFNPNKQTTKSIYGKNANYNIVGRFQHLLRDETINSINKENNSDFALNIQLERTLSKEKGFYIGGGYHFNDDGHLLTVGGSGAGKGVNFIIPALLSPALVASGSSVVVLDPKGENLAICGEHLKRNGYKLTVINPFDIPEISGFGKARFNPFSLTSKNDINAPTFCDLIAECLISDDNQNDHWNDSARQYISLYLLYMVATEQANFKNLFEAVRLGGADRLEYLAKMKDCKAFDGIISATAGGVFNQIMSANGGNSNEIDSIFSTVRRGTEKFKNLQLRDHLKHSDFDLKTIAHEKTALFVCVNPSELKEYSPWLRVLFGCMFNSLKKHYNTKRRVLFLMDEFPQIGRLKEFQTAMVYMRGYNATLWVIVQDLGQLKQLYWDSWESFVGSASVKMWLPLGADNFTIDYLENRLPIVDKLNYIKNKIGGEIGEIQTEKRKIMNKFELITCQDAIIESRNLGSFARFEKTPYWLLDWAKNASPNPFRE